MARVLVIDDDAALRTLISVSLRKAGHVITEAGDGVEALRLCRQQQFDLAICDIFMPKKEGLETIPLMRQAIPELKIVVVSGGSHLLPMTFLPLAQMLGANRVLAKPFTVAQLVATVEDVLTPSQEAQAPSSA